MTDELRSDLGNWLGYLREIGVRELSIGNPEPSQQNRPAKERPAIEDPASSPVEMLAANQGERSASSTGDLFRIGNGTEDEAHDPAARLAEVRRDLGECTRCRLHAGRTNVVFGVGNPRARLMFIGEGPGADEDAQGEPFVGRAGQKLNDMIRAIGLERAQVYIANVVKCRPPDNRDPKPDEIATCSPFLVGQIEAIRPAVIVTLGSPATRTLLNTKIGITRLRGTWHEYRGLPVMPTYHPAYLLRAYTEENRRKVWEDLKAARARMDRDS
jgi:DNA polymerase